jgi:hypothetical protein
LRPSLEENICNAGNPAVDDGADRMRSPDQDQSHHRQ